MMTKSLATQGSAFIAAGNIAGAALHVPVLVAAGTADARGSGRPITTCACIGRAGRQTG
jgi:hypothetical protein